MSLFDDENFIAGEFLVVGFETEGQNNVFEKFDRKQTSLLFSAASKVPIKMRKFGQQMRNAVA